MTYYDPKAQLQLTDMDLVNGKDESYLKAVAGDTNQGTAVCVDRLAYLHC